MMARTTKTIGTGITAEQRTSYSAEDIRPAVDAFAARWASERREAGGDFGAAYRGLVEHAKWILDGDGPTERDSQKYFARRIVELYEVSLTCLEQGDGETAARCAFDMGFLYSQATLKKWEPHTLRGFAALEHSRSGHEKVHGTADQKRARWQAMVDDLQSELTLGTKKTAAYEIVAERHKVSAKTVMRAIGYLRES